MHRKAIVHLKRCEKINHGGKRDTKQIIRVYLSQDKTHRMQPGVTSSSDNETQDPGGGTSTLPTFPPFLKQDFPAKI